MPRIKWIIWLAIAIHTLWGVLLLTGNDSVRQITAVHSSATRVGEWLPFGVMYLTIAAMAFVGGSGFFGPLTRMRNFLLCLPQQFFLVESAWGAIEAIAACQFADGVPRPWAFMAADQGQVVLLALLHTGAIVEEGIRSIIESQKATDFQRQCEERDRLNGA